MVKMKYESLFLAPAAAGMNVYTFRGNSIYDPDSTGTGKRAYGFTQWNTQYNNHLVLGSKMRLTIINGGTPVHEVCLYPSRDSSVIVTTMDNVKNQPYAVRNWLSPQTGSKSTCVLQSYMSTKKIYQVAQIADDASLFGAANASLPTNVWMWHFVFQNSTNLAAQPTLTFFARITYYVRWNGRIADIVQSVL